MRKIAVHFASASLSVIGSAGHCFRRMDFWALINTNWTFSLLSASALPPFDRCVFAIELAKRAVPTILLPALMHTSAQACLRSPISITQPGNARGFPPFAGGADFRLSPRCRYPVGSGVSTMDSNSSQDSSAMLRAVLAGESFVSIASAHHVSPAWVEQRVKTLALALQRVVGVEGVDDDAKPGVASLRQHGEAYLEALSHYQPARRDRRMQARAVSDEELQRLIQITMRFSRCRARDAALILILFATTAKPLEIARMEIRDYLRADGSVRTVSELRPEVAIGGQRRDIYFESRRAIRMLDWYLAERRQRGHGVSNEPSFRGLLPGSRLFLTDSGRPMPIHDKRCHTGEHHLCSTILHIYQRLFARAGLHGVGALSARRTAARKIAELGGSRRDIQLLLGLRNARSARKLLQQGRTPLRTMAKTLAGG